MNVSSTFSYSYVTVSTTSQIPGKVSEEINQMFAPLANKLNSRQVLFLSVSEIVLLSAFVV